jgi:hypothetical protein
MNGYLLLLWNKKSMKKTTITFISNGEHLFCMVK